MDKLSRARARLLVEEPFFGCLLLSMDMIEGPVPTMGTDGVKFYYNPKWINSLDLKVIPGLLEHELKHVVYLHPFRRGSRDLRKWNIACDHAVNATITKPLPKGGLEGIKEKAETIYDKLKDQSSQSFVCDLMDPPKDNNSKKDKDNPGSGAGLTLEQQVIRKIVSSADMAEKMCNGRGSIPQELREWIEVLKGNKINWLELLRNLVSDIMSKTDYSWGNSRRHDNEFLPILKNTAYPYIVIGIDASGSINNEQFTDFINETKSLKEHVEELTVLQSDCNEPTEIALEDIDTGKIHRDFGGGTSFLQVFDWIEKNHKNPACVVYFTDGDGEYPTKMYPFPTIWIISKEGGYGGFSKPKKYANDIVIELQPSTKE